MVLPAPARRGRHTRRRVTLISHAPQVERAKRARRPYQVEVLVYEEGEVHGTDYSSMMAYVDIRTFKLVQVVPSFVSTYYPAAHAPHDTHGAAGDTHRTLALTHACRRLL